MSEWAHLYEDFSVAAPRPSGMSDLSADDIEELKLASFEAGYSSGWEDAVRAHEKGQIEVFDALKKSLQNAKISRDAAFDRFVASAEGLFDGITRQVLPSVSHELLSQQISDVLKRHLRAEVDCTVTISTSRQDFDMLKKIIGTELPSDARLHVDEGLSQGQADIHLSNSETHIDMADVISEVREAFQAFFQISKEAKQDDR